MRNTRLPLQEEDETAQEPETKNDWMERDASSDDEAITLAAAGASGSAALDERTSTMPPAPSSMDGLSVTINNSPPTLRELHSTSVAVISPTLERANYFRESFPRAATGSNRNSLVQNSPLMSRPPLPLVEPDPPEPEHTESIDHGTVEVVEDVEEPATPNGEVSLAQMLMESRIPDLPPPGSRTRQEPIILASNSIVDEPESFPTASPPATPRSARSNRRWSVLGASSDSLRERAAREAASQSQRVTRPRTGGADLGRSQSSRALRTAGHQRFASRHLHSPSDSDMTPPLSAPPTSERRHAPGSHSHSSNSGGSFLPKFISAVLGQRSSYDNTRKGSKLEKDSLQIGPATIPQPKLDYVKLPGTKGSILVKAVETARKRCVLVLIDCGPPIYVFPVSWLFFAEKTVRKWSCSPEHTALLFHSQGHSFCLIHRDP